MVLVNSVVKYANATPKIWIVLLSKNSLLIRIKSQSISVLSLSEASSKEIPGHGISVRAVYGLLQVGNGLFIVEIWSFGVLQEPAVLLKYFGILRIFTDGFLIRVPRLFPLKVYIVNVSNLKPDICFFQR